MSYQPGDGGLGIWALVDLIMVLVGATRDRQGRPLAGYQQHKKTAWIVTAILVALGFIIGIIMGVAGLFSAQNASTVRPADEPVSQSEPEDPAGSAQKEEQATAEEATSGEESATEAEGTDFASWADGAFGTFDPVKETGSGDTVIDMPAGAAGVLITAKYSGDSNFIIQGLDEANEISGALPVNTIGDYEGTTFVSAEGWDATSKLQVTASGSFEITLSPVSTAAAFSGSGSGDAVMQYTEGAATIGFTHDGESNFVVYENSDSSFGPDLLVNEIGSYDGSVPVTSGPSILIVQADGNWTASAR
ncbi:TM2 domain-containing protein [Brevibacterium luteolum]|uniref:TM2 domain-containing protein n=1 Tax=Brevibacterium luteolum TaxID=199591 RepID=UPI001C22A560|nr:TM2 domain-containing protein [Brevibacterium luteolum]MBU8578958.1 TM2 domain-containing protein [Brevibacterium luteolum]